MASNQKEVSSSKNKKWPQFVTVLSSLIIVFSSGVHLGWSSPSVPKLLTDFPLNITSEEASYIVTVSALTQIVGNVLFSILMDAIGRKFALLLAAPVFIVSILCIYLSPASIVLLYVARVLGGVAEGGCNVAAPAYICEIAEPKIRGALGSLYVVFWSCGVLFINLVGSYYTIQTASLITLAFPLLFLVLFSFMPESPYYLLMKKKTEKARRALNKLRWNKNVDQELASVEKDVERQMSEKGRLQDLLFIVSNRRPTVIMCVLSIIQAFSGLAALTSYAQTFFAEATDAIPKEWAAVLMQLIKLVTMLIGASLIDTVGRRILLLISSFGCSVMMTLVSIFFFLRDYSSLEVENFNWLPLVGVLVFVIFFMMGLGIVGYCLLGELFSTSVKSKALCLVSIVGSLCIFASTKLFQFLSDNYSTGVPLFMFGIIQFLGFWFCLWCVPETKKKTLEEIQQELKGH